MDDRSEYGIDPPLKVEGGVEAGILAHLQPRLADQHQRTPSVLQGEILRSSASVRKESSSDQAEDMGKGAKWVRFCSRAHGLGLRRDGDGPNFVAGLRYVYIYIYIFFFFYFFF
ncbi:hypothetical protein ACFX11_011088 [Malus domestica]